MLEKENNNTLTPFERVSSLLHHKVSRLGALSMTEKSAFIISNTFQKLLQNEVVANIVGRSMPDLPEDAMMIFCPSAPPEKSLFWVSSEHFESIKMQCRNPKMSPDQLFYSYRTHFEIWDNGVVFEYVDENGDTVFPDQEDYKNQVIKD